MNRETFLRNFRRQIFWVTDCLAFGPYPDREKERVLILDGVTHILNVGKARTEVDITLFAEVGWVPIEDLQRIPDKLALASLDALHRMLLVPGAKVYVHCSAGQHRSPTIVWLYLIALGMSPEDAEELVSDASPDAVPGHPSLVDSNLIALVRKYGKKHFLPLIRTQILKPIS